MFMLKLSGTYYKLLPEDLFGKIMESDIDQI